MREENDIQVSIEQIDEALIVTPVGDVDLSRSPCLRQALKKSLSDVTGRLIVDLTDVPYMDSSGVATLVEAMQLARRNSVKLVLCGMQDQVRSIFEIARLDRVFSIVPSREDATQV